MKTKIKRKCNWIFDFLGSVLGFDSGKFCLNHGTHEIFIPTKIHPEHVWVKIHSCGHEGCCQVPLNEVAYTTKCKGIAFTVTVATENCTVEWFATT